MRTEWKLFTFLGLFMLPLGVAYAVVGHLGSGIEIAGTILLLIVAVSFAFIGVYLFMQAQRMHGELRPEDWDATPADGIGEVGSFPGASIWPLLGASGVTILAAGLIWGNFFLPIGIGLIFATVIGMARESDISDLHHVPTDHHATPGHKAQTGFSDQVKK
jgi:hypothetical protein